jgi:hypothetical protein
VASPLRFDETRSKDQLAVFRDDRARAITTKDPAVHQALARLATAYPATLTLDELATYPSCGQARAEIEARVCDALFLMVLAGQASISALPLRVGLAAHKRPRAWLVARTEAASGQPWITSLRHAGVPGHPILTVLVPHLDGTHDRSALRVRFTAALQSGAVRVPELPADKPPPPQERLNSVAEQYVERTLRYLERHALLEPDTAQGDRPYLG